MLRRSDTELSHERGEGAVYKRVFPRLCMSMFLSKLGCTRRRALLVSAASAWWLAAPSATAMGSATTDEADRQGLAQSSPVAMAQCEKAEAAAKAGRFAEALDLFERAREEAPTQIYVSRGGCRVALDAKDRTAALRFCQIAFLQSAGNLEDLRNRVVAGVSADIAPDPTMSDLVMAALMTNAAGKRAPDDSWTQSARLELGRRLGDRAAIDAGLARLQSREPNGPLTTRTLESAFARPPLWVWAVRLLCLGFLLATLAHLLLARRRRRVLPASPTTVSPAPLAAIAFALVVCGVAPRAEAAAKKDQVPPVTVTGPERLRFLFNENDPDSTVPSPSEQMQDPLQFGYYLQDGLEAADNAAKAGDHARAARDYGALAKAVPQRALAFAKQCQELELAGDRDGALVACESACLRDGVTLADYDRTARLLLERTGALTADERTKLKLIIDHLAAEKNAPLAAEQIRCQLALRDKDVPALQACSDALAKVAPQDAKTISFQWALAIEKNDRAGARRLVEQAKRAGLPPAAVDKMDVATDKLAPNRAVKVGLGALLSMLVIGLFIAARRRMITARRLVT
jgi:hypothetical protein